MRKKYFTEAVQKLQFLGRLSITAILLIALAVSGCKAGGSSFAPLEGENFDKDASYALGMNIGMMLANDGLVPNLEEFVAGLTDYLSDERNTRISDMLAIEILQTAFMDIEETGNTENMQQGIDFLAQNSRRAGIQITHSGLQYEVVSEGYGERPAADDIVRVHYEGKLIDGTVFDSSFNRGAPAEFKLNDLIPGWIEGLQLMNVGSKYIFYVPQELAYGPGGGGPIPPYSALIFEVELIDIIN